MIAIMGASGNIGRRISEQLLEQGERIRVLGRSAERLIDFECRGAEALTGQASDSAFLAGAFRGASAVYTLLPSDPRSPEYRRKQDQDGEAIVNAVRNSGVRHVVFLSSIVGDLAEGTGPIAGLHAQEERLRRLEGVNVLVLRPGSFFENFYAALGPIKQHGVSGGAIAPNLPMAMIATRDIADVAARALKARDWTGVVVRELLGPRDLTFAEATRILGARIGKPDLEYVQLSYANYEAALVQAGLAPDFAALYAEMARAFNDGKVTSREGRRSENTTPTRFEDFTEALARAYEHA